MHSNVSASQLGQLCYEGGEGGQRSKRLFFRTGATALYSDNRFGGGGVGEQTSWCIACLGAHASHRFRRVSILGACAHQGARRPQASFFSHTPVGENTL